MVKNWLIWQNWKDLIKRNKIISFIMDERPEVLGIKSEVVLVVPPWLHAVSAAANTLTNLGGARDTPPLLLEILSFSCSFRQKSYKIMGFGPNSGFGDPPVWEILDP